MTTKVQPIPEWADPATIAEAMKALATSKTPDEFSPVDLVAVEDFSTLFAEWTFKGNDLLVHLFPRAGKEDRWYPASYRNNQYIPGRREEKSIAKFPDGVKEIIQRATDNVWLGDVAIAFVPELGAFAIQFQDAKNTVEDPSKFVDSFCEATDILLG